jgi:hypothetical protein
VAGTDVDALAVLLASKRAELAAQGLDRMGLFASTDPAEWAKAFIAAVGEGGLEFASDPVLVGYWFEKALETGLHYGAKRAQLASHG